MESIDELYQNNNDILMIYLAPQGVTAAPASPSSITATVQPAVVPEVVDHYVVQIEGHPNKKCSATLPTLSCTITGLPPAAEYTVQAKACLGVQSSPKPCSDVTVGGKSWTNPSSKFLTLTVITNVVQN